MRYLSLVFLAAVVLSGCNDGEKQVEAEQAALPDAGPEPVEADRKAPPKLKGIRPLDESAGGTTASVARPRKNPQPSLPMPDMEDAGSGAKQYTIRKGDTLWSIAKKHLGSGKRWKEITDCNPGLNPQSLRIGQVITLPE